MKKIWMVFTLLILAGCAVPQAEQPALTGEPQAPSDPGAPSTDLPEAATYADLPDLGDAPELENEVWLNTDQALRLADLRGKVVLLEMWTFG